MARFSLPHLIPSRLRRIAPGFFLVVWVLLTAAGFRRLVSYELTPGAAAPADVQWPAHAQLAFDGAHPNLIMFVHPQCPCSRATMAELAIIMTRCPDLHATVCFLAPDDEPDTWTRSGLWRTASTIPGVNVMADRNGRLADQFGSVTSGQVLLFDRDRRKVFSGGITGSRGHEGDNAGQRLVIALARGEVCGGATAPVFGCSLHDAPSAYADLSR